MCIYVCTFVCVSVSVYLCMCVCMCMHVYQCVYVCVCMRVSCVSCRVESGSDDLNNLGHLGHFLAGQVGLIRKLNNILSGCDLVLVSGK